MTIVEFLHPLKGGATRDLCLAALYFAERYNGAKELTVDELRALLKRARVPRAAKLNLADVLAKSAPYVDTAGKRNRSFLWALTTAGRDHVRALLGLPDADVELEHDVAALDRLVSAVPEKDVADYLGEGVKCLAVGALRAAVVFLWTGTARKIQQDCFDCGASNVTAAIQKHDPKARPVKKLDDFAYIKDAVLLLAAQDLGLFDKSQRTTLGECLDLRNKSGHPGKYRPGPKKVGSFIEDLVSVVFSG